MRRVNDSAPYFLPHEALEYFGLIKKNNKIIGV